MGRCAAARGRSQQGVVARAWLPHAGVLALGDFHGVSTQLDPAAAAAAAAAAAGEETAAHQEADAAVEEQQQQRAKAGEEAAVAQEAKAQQQQQEQRQQAGPDSAADEHSATGMPDLQLAAELALTCYELYRRTPAGLAPEIVHFADHSGELWGQGQAMCTLGSTTGSTRFGVC